MPAPPGELANVTEASVCSGGAVLCQINLTACWIIGYSEKMRGYTERDMFNIVAMYSVYHECRYGMYNLICAFWVTIYIRTHQEMR